MSAIIDTRTAAERIRELANVDFQTVVGFRRQLHRHPELSFHEHETAAFVAERLREIGFTVRTGVAGTGVIGDLAGDKPGPTVMLRADIDALPIHETTDLEYASVNAGVMHACGHDLHTACLLGAARILAKMRQYLSGSVRVLFQPAEELAPGGAAPMIAEGALQPSTVAAPSAVFGLHTWPRLPAGTIAVRGGVFMASNDEIEITVRGQGGHAAEPHLLSADPVLVAAHILVALQTVVSRNRPPETAGVLSFGAVHANGATNIIPDTVSISGTLRSMDRQWRHSALHRIQTLVKNTALAFGAEADCEVLEGYPVLINDQASADFVRSEGMSFLGSDKVHEAPLWFAAEDFARYLEHLPGAFFLLGVNRPDVQVTGLHTATYSPDEAAMETGASFLARIALAYCHKEVVTESK